MDEPPSYAEASGQAPKPSTSEHPARNGIPPEHRRSMEDEARPLPHGWVRQFDPTSHHQFFVDTNSKPPRSIWTHPLDDETYLNSLDPDERERQLRLHRSISLVDMQAESSDDEEHHGRARSKSPLPPPSSQSQQPGAPSLPPRPEEQPKGLKKFTRKLKDKVTDSTHEEREQLRIKRSEQERAAYERHLAIRQAMARAMETGQPQLIGRDRNGQDVYIEPPNGPGIPRGAGYGYNPYSSGPYTNPNARFIRPEQPYYRPYGYGYGGGYGFPILGGLLGGAVLGSLLF